MNIITHRTDSYNVDEELNEKRKAFVNDEKKLSLFNQLCEFEYGRWLLINRGLNAYWTYYMIFYEELNVKLHPLESIMIEKSPGVVAGRERSIRDRKIIQNLVKNNMTLASVPCGYMNDLLRLELKYTNGVKLVGVDLDPKAIEYAKENAKKFNKEAISSFYLRDAWALNFENEFDIIHSSGLNIFVQREADLISLYSSFYKAIKPGGFLLTTSNMPPMDDNNKLFWNISEAEFGEMPMQGILYSEIIQVRQGLFCTEKQIINQLTSAGFTHVDVDYDSRKMFLSFIARK
jgi:SAM-dependent methyltransferase